MSGCFGTFINVPTIHNQVCKNCNSVIFSSLEGAFKEDTQEGIYCQMLNLENKWHFRIKNEKAKTKFSSGFGNPLLDEMFPSIHLRLDDRPYITFEPQIKVKNATGGYDVFFIQGLEEAKKDTEVFCEKKAFLSRMESKDFSIFAPADSEKSETIIEAIELLKEYGVDYKQGTTAFAEKREDQQFESEGNYTIDHTLGRVLAKIVFNYFIYCANKEKMGELPFLPNFNRVRNFILGDESIKLKEIIPEIGNHTILEEERDTKRRMVGHIIAFEEINGQIIGHIRLFGLVLYKIILGPAPSELQRADFGCGHFFDPVNHRIIGLSQNHALLSQLKDDTQSPDFKPKLHYGLFLKQQNGQ